MAKKYVSLDKLGLYDEKIKKVISDGDAATLAAAKEYAEGLGANYDAAGSSATVQANLDKEIERAKAAEEANAAAAKQAQDEVDALELVVDTKAAQTDLDALAGKVGAVPEDSTVMDIITNIQENAYDDTAIVGRIEAVEENKADKTQVATDIASAKTELEGKITTAQTAADNAQAHSEGVAGDLAEAVEALEGADAAQVERITALEGTIVGLSGAMHFEGVKDELPADGTGYEQGDVIIVGNKEYVLNGNTFVEFGDATVNAEAITELTNRVTTAEGEIDTLQSEMDAVEIAVSTKAEQTALDEAVEALEGADSAQIERITALENKFGGAEGSVEDMIADAKQEAIDAAASAADTKDEAVLAAAKKYADEEDAKIETRVDALEAASATHALASDVTALATRVTTAEGEIDTLQTEMDAVEALAAANDAAHKANAAAIALKASQADLEALATRVTANEEGLAAFVEVSEEEINALFA